MMEPAKIRRSGDLWAVVSALSTGAGLIVAKIILETLNPISFNGQMFFLGGTVIFLHSALRGEIRETVQIRPAQLLFLVIISVLFCGAMLLLYSALRLSEPATVSFLSRLELVATLILASLFLKERISLSEMAGLILVVAGILVMRYKASVELSKALFLVAASSLLLGIAEVTIKSRINWINHRALIFYRNIFMSVIFFTVGWLTDTFHWAGNLNLVGLLVLAAIFLPYLGRLGYLKAMQNINVSRASIIVQSQPFFAAGLALLVLGTFPPAREVLGGILIVAGVITISLLDLKMRKGQPAKQAAGRI